MFFSLKKWGTYFRINEAKDESDANRNTKPVLNERKQVNKKIESNI